MKACKGVTGDQKMVGEPERIVTTAKTTRQSVCDSPRHSLS